MTPKDIKYCVASKHSDIAAVKMLPSNFNRPIISALKCNHFVKEFSFIFCVILILGGIFRTNSNSPKK